VKKHWFHTSAFSTLFFVLSAMDGKMEQRVCIKFYLKLGKSATEILETPCEAFGEHYLSRTAVFEWYSHFKAAAPAQRQKILKILRTHPRRPSRRIQELANTAGINCKVCQGILT
jgi:hypothetical protein